VGGAGWLMGIQSPGHRQALSKYPSCTARQAHSHMPALVSALTATQAHHGYKSWLHTLATHPDYPPWLPTL